MQEGLNPFEERTGVCSTEPAWFVVEVKHLAWDASKYRHLLMSIYCIKRQALP